MILKNKKYILYFIIIFIVVVFGKLLVKKMPTEQIEIRKSESRGKFDGSWLKARHTFSFASYYDPNFVGFGDLLVINDDRIVAKKGFDMHAHKNMEIFTYILKGEMEHIDSENNSGIIKTGEFQYMAAGTGVEHSEKNPINEETRLLQIWILPNKTNVKPYYKSLSKEKIIEMQKTPLTTLASSDGKNGSIKMNQNAEIFLLQLKDNETFELNLNTQKMYYFQVAEGIVNINSQIFKEGDGAKIQNVNKINNSKLFFKNIEQCKLILFELKIK